MRRKVHLVGGHFDGMETFVDLDKKEVRLVGPSKTPEATYKPIYVYRKRRLTAAIFDWVNDES